MTEKKDTWTIDELVNLTNKVQKGETEYNGKKFTFQYCELTEGEEPKMKFAPDGASEEEKNEKFKEIGQARIIAMIAKANEKNPEGISITQENWSELPSTIRWGVSNSILGSADDANFRELDETSA